MSDKCTKNNCRHEEDQHPDPTTCGGSEKCTTDVCQCEGWTP